MTPEFQAKREMTQDERKRWRKRMARALRSAGASLTDLARDLETGVITLDDAEYESRWIAEDILGDAD